MTLHELLIREAADTLKKQKGDGSFPPGHNGPYKDPETPVRNTSHWLFTLCRLYELTHDPEYHRAAMRAADYLLSEKARPGKGSFWCRKNPRKDTSNGVIGQAWVIEALVLASKVLNREECYRLAEEIFLLHSWDGERGYWKKVALDGSEAGVDTTFNHQLWFGAIAGLLRRTDEALQLSREFFDRQAVHARLYQNGVIFHNSPLVRFTPAFLRPGDIYRGIRQYYRFSRTKKSLWSKSAGYHAFNLYAFALYRETLPDHPYWKSEHFRNMLSALEHEEFVREQMDNPYSYPYNPVGIELAYVLETFVPDKPHKVSVWLERQFRVTAEPGSVMTGKSVDPETSSARIYEATRIRNNYQVALA